MLVATMELCLRLHGCRSLKDKRRVLRSLLQKSRQDLHVSAAETGDHDLWGNAVIGVAAVTADADLAQSILQRVLDLYEDHPQVEVESVYRELIRTGP